jgi:hypothetical protein
LDALNAAENLADRNRAVRNGISGAVVGKGSLPHAVFGSGDNAPPAGK